MTLGRKLAKGLETEEEEEEEEDFYDVSDVEVSGIVFSPVKRYQCCAWALGWEVPSPGVDPVGILRLVAFGLYKMSETFRGPKWYRWLLALPVSRSCYFLGFQFL